MRSPIAVLSTALVLLTGCNAGDVMTVAHQHGINLTATEAQSVADHYNACDADVECTIRAVFPDNVEDRALRIARCESGLNPRARNPRSSAAGTFQIIAATWRAYADAGMDIFNARDNTVVAHRIWQSSGFTPWVCR